MDELLNEHEQGERVRSWLQKNALGLIGGIAFGLALIFGWNWWKQQQASQRDAVAAEYDLFTQVLATNPEQASKLLGGKLAGTAYAAVGALELAKAQVDAGKEAAALATLQAAKTEDPELGELIRQRTAELMVANGKAEDAVRLLGKPIHPAALEVLGDAQTKLGKPVEAQASYRQALRLLEEGSPERQVVELKLADVGGSAS